MATVLSRLRGARGPASDEATLSWLQVIERKIGVTPTGLAVAGVAVLGIYLASRIASQEIFLLAYGLVFVLVSAFVLGRRRLSLEVERSELPRRVRQGQPVDVELKLTARRRVSTIVVQDELATALANAPARVPVPALPAGQSISHPYSFTPKRRGVYQVGPLVATWTDPFGFTRRRALLAEPVEIIVHPSTELVHDRVFSRAWEDPPVRPPVSKPWPTGFEFYGMRDYEPGDDPRHIVWRATARTLDPVTGQGRYLVRQAEQGITDRVLIVLDTDVEWHSPGVPSETFESSVRVAASLGARHLNDGFAVSVETNDRKICDALRGRRNRIRLLDEMARVQLSPAPFSSLLERMITGAQRDTHVVMITPYLDQTAATRIRILIDRGAAVLLVLILNDDSEPDSLHRAGTLGTNIVEVTAGAPLEAVFHRVRSGGRR